MSWGAVIAGGAALVGGAMSSNASKKAAKTQSQSTDRASEIQKEMYEQTRKDLDPYNQAGNTALSQIMGDMGPDGYFNQSFSARNLNDDPSYQFRLQQGTDAIQSSAAAQGGLLSGATLKALQNYGQDYASQEYSNAYNRFNADQTNRFNRLSTLAGMGQNAAAQVGNNGMQTAQAIANNTMAGANAQAAGQIGQANAWGNAIGQVGTIASAYLNGKGKSGGTI